MKPFLDVIERASGLPPNLNCAQPPGGALRDPAPRRPKSEAGHEVHFPPRALIFLEGDEALSIFQVLHGAVMLYKLLPDGRRQVVEVLGVGDVFGCSPRPVRGCSAETLLATRCLALDRDLVERSPTLSQWLNARLRAQLCALHEHVTLLGRKSAMERITSFLIGSVPGRGHYGCPGPQAADDDANIRLTMTRQEIADYLGLTIETVSRLLTRLKRRGVIVIGKLDEIYIQDVCRLCRLTGTHLTRGRWCSSHMEGNGSRSVR